MKVKAVTVLSNATAERSTVEWEDLKLYHKKRYFSRWSKSLLSEAATGIIL